MFKTTNQLKLGGDVVTIFFYCIMIYNWGIPQKSPIVQNLPIQWITKYFLHFCRMEWQGGLTHRQKIVIWMMIPVKITLMTIFNMCVRLESRMLITITNSNSSPEVNSSEVSLKTQCELRVCTQKHPNHLLGCEAYVTFGLSAHMCLYTNSFFSRICVLKTNYNHHCNDHSNYEFSLVCKVRSF